MASLIVVQFALEAAEEHAKGSPDRSALHRMDDMERTRSRGVSAAKADGQAV